MTQEAIFVFSGHEWDSQEKTAKFFYKLQKGSEEFNFVETLSFPLDGELAVIPQELLKNSLDNLLLALGISYYKLFCPKKIILENITLSKEQAEFWNTVYTKGLGEFFYNNKIDFRDLINFPSSNSANTKPISFPRQNRSLIGIGGGKDSIVTAELLKVNSKPFASFILKPHPLQEKIAKLIGGKALTIRREIDSQIFTLNKRSDTYNGHIPISAIYAFIGFFLAILYDFRFVIVSNEHSSNYGNIVYKDMEVNHQWSKSLEFETLFQTYTQKFLTPDITYFSLLRPLTEIGIVKKFVNYPRYFASFSSCNRNFKITEKEIGNRWCGECAKCAFAFLMLSAFLPKEKLMGIFAQDLFAESELLQTYKELLGVEAFKPFDCVGTPEEVKVAFYLAMQKGEYDENIVMKFFKKEVLPKVENIKKLEKQVFEVSKEHSIPGEFQKIIQ